MGGAKYSGVKKNHWEIKFTVSGGVVRNKEMFWRARCKSGQTLSRGTSTASIALANGEWRGHGHYSAQLPYAANMTGKFNVLEDDGEVRGSQASGDFHLNISLYIRGRRVDRCDTGVIHWHAQRR